MKKPWTDSEVEVLRSRWEGAAVAAIAADLFRSPDSVANKARALGLRPRNVLRPPKKAKVRKTPMAVEVQTADVEPISVKIPVPVLVQREVPLTAGEALEQRMQAHPLAKVGANDCRWPLGHPRDEDFHFCRDRVVEGRSYCREHLQRSYQGKAPVKELLG